MRLTDLNPQWVDAPGRRGIGLLFDCPAERAAGPGSCAGCTGRHLVWLHNPLDGGPRASDAQLESLPAELWALHPGSPVHHWHRSGEILEDLSLAPRIDAAAGWHCWVTRGEVLLGGPAPKQLSPETRAWLSGEGEPGPCTRPHVTAQAAEVCAEQLAINDPDYGL